LKDIIVNMLVFIGRIHPVTSIEKPGCFAQLNKTAADNQEENASDSYRLAPRRPLT
jgi:hypothetical protein